MRKFVIASAAAALIGFGATSALAQNATAAGAAQGAETGGRIAGPVGGFLGGVTGAAVGTAGGVVDAVTSPFRPRYRGARHYRRSCAVGSYGARRCRAVRY